MTREEIREVIDRRIDGELLRFARLVVDNSDWNNLALVSREEIKHILRSQGVVIRGQKHPRYIGYFSVEPLIKD